jgi:N-methylhydantoinase A
MEYIVGVDIGGTFTDCVVLDASGTAIAGKALSTPENFSIGALNAVADAALNIGIRDECELLASTLLFFHACTVADNTLITRSGPKTGLITTNGFADTLLLMRGRTTEGLTETEAFRASTQSKPEPIVPRRLIEEITERMDYKGSVVVSFDRAQAEKAVERLAGKGVESLAIALLWSLTNDSHEQALASIIRQRYPEIYLSLSSEVAPFIGEYERTATTAFNAYIVPAISKYLRDLRKLLAEKGLRREPLIMQSYGGVLGIEDACRSAVGMIESGPASGIAGSRSVGLQMGMPHILATDMGGTTFKVGVIRDGVIEKEYKPVFLRYQIFLTKIWVESIGAGGGSIVWIDPETGLLKVGPQGAGAQPGPICYGLGGSEVTVSDADLVLGYLNEDYFLGGKMRLDKARALAVLDEKIAKPMGMTAAQAASGIYRIINSHMSDLIRKSTVERGYDPRDFTLFAYGGAGPVHAGRYSSELGIKQVVVPLTASVHGATGLVSSDVVYTYGKSDHVFVPADMSRINKNFSELVTKAVANLSSVGFKNEDMEIVRSLDIRYRQQVHELNVPLEPGVEEISQRVMDEVYDRFDQLYEQTYGPGAGYREAGKEIMVFRLAATGRLNKPRLKSYTAEDRQADNALKGYRRVYFEEYQDFVRTQIFDNSRLGPGAEIPGPAIIETPITTIVINPNDRASVDEFLNVRIDLGGR